MRLLAFDTAADRCSAGVFIDGRPLAVRQSDGSRGHAERLPRLIEAALVDAATALEDLDALAVTIGPGSFSGIRTGLAAARGLALVTGLRILPVSTLEALAAPTLENTPRDGTPAAPPVAAILDARRGELFLQRFTAAGEPRETPRTLTPEAAAVALDGAWRLVGNGAASVLAQLDRERPTVVDAALDAAGVALAAERARRRGMAPVAGFDLHPCYARDADARPGAGRPLVRLEA